MSGSSTIGDRVRGDSATGDRVSDHFVVAPPGHQLTLADFRPELCGADEP